MTDYSQVGYIELKAWLDAIIASQIKSATHMRRLDLLEEKLGRYESDLLKFLSKSMRLLDKPELSLEAARLLERRLSILGEWHESISDVHMDSYDMGIAARDICLVLAEIAKTAEAMVEKEEAEKNESI